MSSLAERGICFSSRLATNPAMSGTEAQRRGSLTPVPLVASVVRVVMVLFPTLLSCGTSSTACHIVTELPS
jgi:hypothetical protein